MTPSTHQMVRQAGGWAVTVALLLSLAVVLLRLAALPLTLAAAVLDKGAELAARPLTASVAAPDWGTRR